MDALPDRSLDKQAPSGEDAPRAEGRDRPPPHPRGPRGRVLLLLFCCWHAGYLVYSIVPRMAGQDAAGAPVLDAYRFVTGSRQVWRLFHTIPRMRSLQIQLEAEEPDGTLRCAGVLLPGFGACPVEENSRFYTLTERLLASPQGIPYRESYVRKVNGLLNAGRPPGDRLPWSLVFEGEALRDLFFCKIDKRLSAPFRSGFGPEKAAHPQPSPSPPR